jgi:hypothetical protein
MISFLAWGVSYSGESSPRNSFDLLMVTAPLTHFFPTCLGLLVESILFPRLVAIHCHCLLWPMCIPDRRQSWCCGFLPSLEFAYVPVNSLFHHYIFRYHCSPPNRIYPLWMSSLGLIWISSWLSASISSKFLCLLKTRYLFQWSIFLDNADTLSLS